VAGLFGFGGATIMVSLLLIVFTQIVITRNSDVFRIGTSLATIIVTSISSFMPHYKKVLSFAQCLKTWHPAWLWAAF